MATNNDKHIITNDIVWIKPSFFTCLSTNDVASIVFHISSGHTNSNLSERCFLHKQLLIFKYSTILHALLHSQSYILGFHI